MTRLLLASAAALGMLSCAAMAQTTIVQTPGIVAPPPGTLSTTTEKSVDMGGTQTNSTQTTYRNGNGVASDSVTKSTTYSAPPPPVVSSTTTRSTTTTQTQ